MKYLTWNEIADLYDSAHGGAESMSRPARTLPLSYVFDWVAKNVEDVKVTDDGYMIPKEDK